MTMFQDEYNDSFPANRIRFMQNANGLEQIRNYYAPGDNIATGGQPAAGQFPLLAQAGFEVVVNLARPDSPGAIANEDRIVRELCLIYESVPVDFHHPAGSDLDQFCAIMQRHRGKKIFVHCAYNWRVSCFMYLYRVTQCRCPHAEAWADLQRVWQPDPVWQKFIDSALAGRRP